MAGNGEANGGPGSKKANFSCLRCQTNVGPKAKSVKCSTCQLLVHAWCEGISAEMFNKLSHPEQFGLSWMCTGCRPATWATAEEEVVDIQTDAGPQVETLVQFYVIFRLRMFPAKSLNGASSRILNGPSTKSRL